MDLPTGHPRFLADFDNPLYSDTSGDFATFGTDEGADLFAEWSHRINELSETTTLRQLLDDGVHLPAPSAVDELTEVGPDGDSIIISARFTLRRLTGHIDDEGRQFLLDALTRSTSHTPSGLAEFNQMAKDLNGSRHEPLQHDATRETAEAPASKPLPPASRHVWLSVYANREEHGTTMRLPNAYRQHLGWLTTQLNQDRDWWAWWDHGRGHASVLSGWIDWNSTPRPKPKLRTRMSAGTEMVNVTIEVPTAEVTALDANELARFSMNHVLLARRHVEQLLASVIGEDSLTTPPSLPQTKRERNAQVV
jgi:uncharacterized protein YfeS